MADQEYTLVEAAKAEKPSVQTGYIGIYANSYQPFFVAPVLPSGRQKDWQVEDDLPFTGTTGSRSFGADFDATQANFKPYSSQVKFYGGKIKVDEAIVDLMPETVPQQRESQVKAFARCATIDTFEGVGAKALKGVRHYLGGDNALATTVIAPGYENQVVQMGATANGDVLTLAKLDEVIDKVDIRPGKTFIYCNSVCARVIKALNRGNSTSGYNVVFDPSKIGVFDYVYENLPIIVMKDGKNANMLSTTEQDSANANATTCSLYVVTWDVDAACYFSPNPVGIAGTPVPMLKEESDGSNYRYSRFVYYLGFAPQIPRSIARLERIKNALA